MSKYQVKKGAYQDGYTNSFWNLWAPMSNGTLIAGAVDNVVVEVAVDQTIRYFMGSRTNWTESILTHMYALPFIGMLNFGEEYGDLPGSFQEFSVGRAVGNGVKSIPGTTVGFIAMKMTKAKRLEIPNFGSDFLIMLASQIVSRTLTEATFGSLPVGIQKGIQLQSKLSDRYRRKSKQNWA